MSSPDRRAWQAFARLADTLTADFDVIEFLHTLAEYSADLIGASACGIVLADHGDRLNLVAASTEQARLLELSELDTAKGPCADAYHTRAPVRCPDLPASRERWPAFAAAALAAGFAAVHALPMRLRDQAIGAMALYFTQPADLSDQAAGLGQALADVATIGILHERTLRHREMLIEQLQNALTSRIVIEQAKGVLAERLGLTIDDAFGLLRGYTRSHNLKLADTALAVINGDLHITAPD